MTFQMITQTEWFNNGRPLMSVRIRIISKNYNYTERFDEILECGGVRQREEHFEAHIFFPTSAAYRQSQPRDNEAITAI